MSNLCHPIYLLVGKHSSTTFLADNLFYFNLGKIYLNLVLADLCIQMYCKLSGCYREILQLLVKMS